MIRQCIPFQKTNNKPACKYNRQFPFVNH
jgi:hypothetical protein